MNRFDSINHLVEHHLRDLPDGTVRVVIVLWKDADRSGWSIHPLSIGEIAHLSGLSPKTVRNVLSNL